MQKWIIVNYKNKLALALAWEYEYDDYARVSRKDWCYEDKKEAMEYMKDLAKEWMLKIDVKYHP